ncbi:hypothetical protein SAMN05192561_104132 [Halopenitus malekzadehii]|uniref:PIN domain-containing protein n=1 Tax=Halopenitus malekzadehii TaxID=1267564 RepID=A0A1H6IXF7_9EURY|nr:hypothetical protein SAMN05192561_104132 [Halopenitus malekzadehii]
MPINPRQTRGGRPAEPSVTDGFDRGGAVVNPISDRPVCGSVHWSDLFDRPPTGVTRSDVRDALAARRSPPVDDEISESPADDRTSETGDARDDSADDGDDSADDGDDSADDGDGPDPSIARIVVDADVLAADLLVGGEARAALDRIRGHSWLTIVATPDLLADAQAVISDLAGLEIASAWRSLAADRFVVVDQPPGDHPALAAAYRGGAMHVLSFDPDLTGVAAGVALRDRVDLSVREPRAFTAVFDPERLYPTVVGGEYPGPDRDPHE